MRNLVAAKNLHERWLNALNLWRNQASAPPKKARTNPHPFNLIERQKAFVTPIAQIVHVAVELLGLRHRIQYGFKLIRRSKGQLPPDRFSQLRPLGVIHDGHQATFTELSSDLFLGLWHERGDDS